MKTATEGNPPDWFTRPDSIVGVNVCRLSGQLPNIGCSSVQTMNPDSTIATKSMVYTEYFVKGQQPTTLCPLHPGGDIGVAAAMQGTTPVPVAQATTGAGSPIAIPSSPAPAASPTVATTPPAPPQKKKGFWHKIFGGGGGGGG
jgi:hypothetical protein